MARLPECVVPPCLGPRPLPRRPVRRGDPAARGVERRVTGLTKARCRTGSCWRWPTSAWDTRRSRAPCWTRWSVGGRRVEATKTDGAVAFAATDWLPLQLLRSEAEARGPLRPGLPGRSVRSIGLLIGGAAGSALMRSRGRTSGPRYADPALAPLTRFPAAGSDVTPPLVSS